MTAWTGSSSARTAAAGCADLTAPIDLAITLDFAGRQPSFFATSPASARTAARRRRSPAASHAARAATAPSYTLAPHCHGTHTECVGHVTSDGTHIAALTPVAPCLALLVTVEPVLARRRCTAASAHAAIRRTAASTATRWQPPRRAGHANRGPRSSCARCRTRPTSATARITTAPCPGSVFPARRRWQWIVERDVDLARRRPAEPRSRRRRRPPRRAPDVLGAAARLRWTREQARRGRRARHRTRVHSRRRAGRPLPARPAGAGLRRRRGAEPARALSAHRVRPSESRA